MSLTQPLSVILQNESIDLSKASDVITTLVATLNTRRTHAGHHFNDIFSDATQMADKLDVEVRKPRTCGRQSHRNNHPSQSCEDFYRVSAYIPLIDMVIEDLKTRFSKEVFESFNLSRLLPKFNLTLGEKDIAELIECLVRRFGRILPGNKELQKSKLKAEVALWQQQWKMQKTTRTQVLSALETLSNCDKDIYPTIHILLRVLCTLPATNASAERSFSSLRRIKTWLRTTMLQKRLNGLALLNINYDIAVEPEEVIERFSKMSKHRIDLIL